MELHGIASCERARGGERTGDRHGARVGFASASAFNYFQDHDVRDLYRDVSDDGGNRPDDNSDEYRKARYGH